jgi:hypothetical protein
VQLRTARLCLDCEELHEEPQCPTCASESFTYLTRWVPVDERRRSRRPQTSTPPSVPPSATARWAKRGAAGLAAIAVGRWVWGAIQPRDAEFEPKPRNRS